MARISSQYPLAITCLMKNKYERLVQLSLLPPSHLPCHPHPTPTMFPSPPCNATPYHVHDRCKSSLPTRPKEQKNHEPRFGTENLEHTDGENVAAIGKPYLTTSFRDFH